MTNILIADSGSTKTDWQLIGPANQPGQLLQTDGFNPYYETTAHIVAGLRSQLLPQLVKFPVAAVFYYGTGCVNTDSNDRISVALRRVLPRLQRVEIASDILGAARAVSPKQPGIVCILGTGSNACFFDGNLIRRNMASLGFWLGDEGSGGYLGKTLVRLAFQDQLPHDLAHDFQEKYHLNRDTLLENAYRKPYPNRYFAGFTPFLTEHATHPFVQQLITDAFELFLKTYLVRWPEAQQFPVHFVGSIAHYFEGTLRQAVANANLTMGDILKSPIEQLARFHSAIG
jgi:glucosamine kinase